MPQKKTNTTLTPGFVYSRAAIQHIQDAITLVREGTRFGGIDKGTSKPAQDSLNAALDELIIMQSKTTTNN